MTQGQFETFRVGMSAVNHFPRTNYACDACRRQKIKCYGSQPMRLVHVFDRAATRCMCRCELPETQCTQPCKKCSQSGLRCTYGSASGRSAVGYTRQLEQQVAALQSQIRKQPQSPDTHSTSQNYVAPAQVSLADTLLGPEDDYIIIIDQNNLKPCNGRFSLDQPPSDYSEAFVEYYGGQIAEVFDSATFDWNSITGSAISLPSQETSQETILIALNNSLNCMECIDRKELWPEIHALYKKDPQHLTGHDKSILALMYALMALGRRYNPDLGQTLPEDGSRRILARGFGYFRASRTILDSLEGADLNSIVASCYLAYYLLSVSMISKAYSCLCTAVSAALRIGLHLSDSLGLELRFSIDELRRRRRVFAVLQRMDTCISEMFGSPELLRHVYRDRAHFVLGSSLTHEGYALIDEGPMSPLTEALYSAQLYQISSRILQSEDRPLRRMSVTSSTSSTFNVDYQAVTEFEKEINAWHVSLPSLLPDDIDQRTLRSQMLLRLQHAAVELSLYRPFLHHLNRDTDDPNFQYQGYAFGSSCLRASTQIVYIIESMDKQGFLHEAQAYTLYLLALAATSLIFFVLKWNEGGPTVEESRAALKCAMGLLARHGEKNISARRCHSLLSNLLTERNYSIMASGWSKSRFLREVGAAETDEPTSEAPF